MASEERGMKLNLRKLPIELRLKIWRHGLALRIVKITYAKISCPSSARIPVVLHVCSESGREALQLYKLGFGSKATYG
jgi:hypothetical protein